MSGHFDISEVLPRGIMIGSALLLTVIQYENTFHQNITFYVFWTSTILHNALNWRVVARYFHLALVVVVIPILIALPYSHISLSFLSSRVPIIIVFMSLFIEEYSRSEMRHRRRWERAPSARRVLLDDLEVNHHALDDGLLLHINGGVGEQYHPPSQASSDISLTTSAPGRLPSSCETAVREFWSEPDQESETREESDGGARPTHRVFAGTHRFPDR